MGFAAESKKLIDQNSFDSVEALWMERMEKEPRDVGEFLETAKMLRKAGERDLADALLDLLGEALYERKAWPERLEVLKEIGRLTRKPDKLRPALEEALTHTLGSRPSFDRVMEHAKFSEPGSNPVERAEKVETWLSLDEGEIFYMSGRGIGVVTDLNPDLGVCRLDFENEKRVSVPLGAASRFLTPIPSDHVLHGKIDDADRLRGEALAAPAEFFGAILRSFGRPMQASEVKDAMIGILPSGKWSSWWNAARKHPQIVVTGSGSKATYSWSESTGEAEQSIREEFERAAPRERLDLARRHSGRSVELSDEFARTLAADADRIAASDPALAWEILATLEKLPGDYRAETDPGSLLQGPAAARVVTSIPDRLLRERALQTVRDEHPEWLKLFSEIFFAEEDPRVVSVLVSMLEQAGHFDVRDRLIDETLRYPRRHPRAFFWYVKSLHDSAEELPDRANYTMLQHILEALSMDQFSAYRSRMREFFDKGGLAVRIVMQTDDEESARKLFETMERYGALEEYRRENMKGAILLKFPKLREPVVELVYATAESLQEKRKEFDRLKNVEIPATLKAIQVAREMGDLRENFEYKAARQRQEYLAARVSELQSELSRVRVLDPAEIDTSEVRVGTTTALRNGDIRRDVTILGPWESDPERGIYSNQSEVAKAMVGRHIGEIVSFMGNDYLIEGIARWTERQA
ncbi:MAG: GreA/GreB family elongation factor [Thermoanaerobaculia bacterium]